MNEDKKPDIAAFAGLINGANADAKQRATLNFNCSPNDMALIVKCGARCYDIVHNGHGVECDAMLQAMNLAAVHCNGRPMKLLQLLMADNSDFIRDMGNIHHFLNTETGKLPDSLKLIFEEPRQ